MILICGNSHKLCFWKYECAHVLLADLVNIHVLVSGIQHYMESRLVFVHRVEYNLQTKVKALLHCAIFLATCLVMPLRDKLLENCTVYHRLFRNFSVARSVARSRTQFNFSQRIAATGNTIAPCITPPATCLAILRQF